MKGEARGQAARTLLHHFLDGARRIDFHSVEVIESVDLGRIFRELLAKGIREVVSGISGLR